MADPQEIDSDLEKKLAEALRKQPVAPGRVPDRVDAAILAAIEAKSVAIKQTHWRAQRARRFVYAAAAAAALLLACFGVPWFRHEPPPSAALAPTPAPTAAPVDIVDAYRLACSLQAGQALRAWEDFNRDGRVDFADVEAMARQAVRIASGTKQEERNHG